jgi:hypothetical protein
MAGAKRGGECLPKARKGINYYNHLGAWEGMSWGFEVGRIYNRRNDIHARFGGQQQGGIITPRDHPLVIIITGEEGLQHGYADRLRPDGVFEYFGEGQVGAWS